MKNQEERNMEYRQKFNTRDNSNGMLINKFRGRSRRRRDVECYYCKKKGCMKREHMKFKKVQQENSDACNVAATIFHGDEVIFVGDDEHVNLIL